MEQTLWHDVKSWRGQCDRLCDMMWSTVGGGNVTDFVTWCEAQLAGAMWQTLWHDVKSWWGQCDRLCDMMWSTVGGVKKAQPLVHEVTTQQTQTLNLTRSEGVAKFLLLLVQSTRMPTVLSVDSLALRVQETQGRQAVITVPPQLSLFFFNLTYPARQAFLLHQTTQHFNWCLTSGEIPSVWIWRPWF